VNQCFIVVDEFSPCLSVVPIDSAGSSVFEKCRPYRCVHQHVLFGGAAADDGVRCGDHFQLGTEKPSRHRSFRGGADGGQLFGVVCGGVGYRWVAMVGDVGVVQWGGEVNVPFFCFSQSEGFLEMFDLLFSIISVTLGISEIKFGDDHGGHLLRHHWQLGQHLHERLDRAPVAADLVAGGRGRR